jgi:hypothetical protein
MLHEALAPLEKVAKGTTTTEDVPEGLKSRQYGSVCPVCGKELKNGKKHDHATGVVAEALSKAVYEECPHCGGKGCGECSEQGLVEHVHKAEEFTKPGTANVSPADLKKLRPLLEHYRKMVHPFRACKRDQMKHGLSEEHANRRCAVIKDLIEGNTHWRGKSKVVPVSGEWTEEVVEALDSVADQLYEPDDGGAAMLPVMKALVPESVADRVRSEAEQS